MGSTEEADKSSQLLSCLKKDKKAGVLPGPSSSQRPPDPFPADADMFFRGFHSQQPWTGMTPTGRYYEGLDGLNSQRTVYRNPFHCHYQGIGFLPATSTPTAPSPETPPPAKSDDPPAAPLEPPKNDLVEQFKNLSTEEQQAVLEGVQVGRAGVSSATPTAPPASAKAKETAMAEYQECVICGDLKSIYRSTSEVMVCFRCESQHVMVERLRAPGGRGIW